MHLPAGNPYRETQPPVYRRREEIHRSLVVTSCQSPHTLKHAFQDETVEVLHPTSGLFVAVVGIKIDVADKLVNTET